jgi:hypothetical protein
MVLAAKRGDDAARRNAKSVEQSHRRDGPKRDRDDSHALAIGRTSARLDRVLAYRFRLQARSPDMTVIAIILLSLVLLAAADGLAAVFTRS